MRPGLGEACAMLDSVWKKSPYRIGDLPTRDEARRAIQHATRIRDAVAGPIG